MKMKGWSLRAGREPVLDDSLSRWLVPLMEHQAKKPICV